jgi:hypothetical protein
MDKAYDIDAIHRGCMDLGVTPIVPLRDTAPVKRGAAEAPHCIHGRWRFAGADYERKASKWRCPASNNDDTCSPASRWIEADRLHPLIPRDSDRFKALYNQRVAIEREFGLLKHEWGLVPLRTRGLDRVQLHTDLTILARLACALVRARQSSGDGRRPSTGFRKPNRHA